MLTSSKECDFSTPPATESGEPFFVDYRFNVMKLDNVNTVNRSFHVRFRVVLHWTDPRLVGWSSSLPNDLWGPTVRMGNAIADATRTQMDFSLTDPAEGRLKRIIVRAASRRLPASSSLRPAFSLHALRASYVHCCCY